MGSSILIAQESDIITVDADTFYKYFNYAKEHKLIEHTEGVLLRTLEHYRNNCEHFFMVKDYSAGVAVEKCGRIISLFSTQNYKKVSSLLIKKAIEAGGDRLECNDVAQLRYIYGKHGFIPVSRSNLNEDDIYWQICKDKGDNRAVILFWIYGPSLENYNQINPDKKFPNDARIKFFDTEEQAEKYRDNIIDSIKNANK